MKEDIEIKNNPFFEDFGNEYDAIPFDKIRTEHFLPAVKASIKEAKKNLKSIKNNSEAPNFNNTILALETSAERLEVIASAFDILSISESNDAMDELSENCIRDYWPSFVLELLYLLWIVLLA